MAKAKRTEKQEPVKTRVKPTTARDVLIALVQTIDATGGVIKQRSGYLHPVADPDWIDLGDVYAQACAVLGRPMKVCDAEDAWVSQSELDEARALREGR